MPKLSFYINFHIHSDIKIKQSPTTQSKDFTLQHDMEYFSEMPHTFPAISHITSSSAPLGQMLALPQPRPC